MSSAVIEAPREMMEAVAALHLPAGSDRRLRDLMDRNNEGVLSSQEKSELADLVELSETISLVRADALQLLGRRPE